MEAPRRPWPLAFLALGLLAAGACSRKSGERADLPIQDGGRKPVETRAEGGGGTTLTAPWPQAQSGGPAVLVSLKRAPGRLLFYEGSMARQQEGKNKLLETATYYLAVANNGAQEGFDRLTFLRTYLDRTGKETLENGKVTDRILPNTSEFVNLGPNCDFVGNQRCYAFDSQNRMAYRADEEVVLKSGQRLVGTITQRDEQGLTILTPDGEQRQVKREEIVRSGAIPRPHVLQYDTPHYFFPIFSKNPVSPGDTWAFRVPAIIPIEQGDARVVLPTQFEIRMVARLREVRGAGETQTGVVDYRYEGAFDSAKEPFTERFPAEFQQSSRVVHGIAGQGCVTVQLAQGRLLEKQEDFTVHLAADSSVAVSPSVAPKEQHQRADISSRLTLRLLPPGTKLRNGEVVPPSE